MCSRSRQCHGVGQSRSVKEIGACTPIGLNAVNYEPYALVGSPGPELCHGNPAGFHELFMPDDHRDRMVRQSIVGKMWASGVLAVVVVL